MLTFNTDGMVQQEFPFPAPIMDYIFKNLTASQLLKLYQSCKFFYNKFRFNIVEDLEIRYINTHERIVSNSLTIWDKNPAWMKLKNLWISKSFTVVHNKENEELDYTKFARLTFDKLEICADTFVNDFEYLVKCPTLRHLVINGKILDPETKVYLSVEEISERSPHVSTLDLTLYAAGAPPIDMAKLLSLNRQTKLQLLHLYNAYQMPDPLLIVEFFKKHGVPNIDYYFDFSAVFQPDTIKAFYKTVNDGLRAWKHSLQLPPTISSFIDLTGKTALITGAAEGIGKATVILFRQLGASVIAVAKNSCQLKSLIEESAPIQSEGFMFTVSIDASTDFDLEELCERIEYKFGSNIDILVNNVDISGFFSVPNIPVEHGYLDMFYVLVCQHNIIEALKEYLIEAKGTVINVSTSHGLITESENAAAIADIEQRLKIKELELVSTGVRINTINSGIPPTTLQRRDGMNDITYKKYLHESKKTYEKEVANAIAFLASDAAKLIDGATLPVNVLNLR